MLSNLGVDPMWHLKTKLGTFWVIPVKDNLKKPKHIHRSQFYLGVNDEELGMYTDAEQAAKDVHDQQTGFYKWDSQPRIFVPEHIDEWVEGEPTEWKKQ